MKLLIVLGLVLSSSPFLEGGSPFQPYNYQYELGQVRYMARILVANLRALNAHPNSARIIRKIFEKNNKQCLRDMNDALWAINEGAKLLENASGDIQSLVLKVQNMIGLKDEAEIVREVASIMRSLTPLLTKLTPESPSNKVCRSNSDSTFDYLHSLAVILEELSEDPQLAVHPELNRMLVYSGSVVAGVTGFLRKMRVKTEEFQDACTGDRLSGMRAVSALGDMMVSLADMVSTLGGLATGRDIREGRKIAERIEAQLGILKDFQGYYTCSPGENMNSAAAAMEDLSYLIQDIGLDNLQQELGVNLYSVFDF